MEEEKKNNKGLMVGIILFLVICLISIFYFMFKMTYVGNKTTNEKTEQTQTETEDNNKVLFTELTKYELQEGEEKEVTVGDKTISISKKETKLYLNDKEVEKNTGFYVTNKFIIFYNSGQNGETYEFYDLKGEKIYSTPENNYYWNLRIENQKLLVDGADTTNYNLEYGTLTIENISIEPCDLIGNGKGKSINEYSNIIENHKEESLEATYNITIKNQTIIIELEKKLVKVEKYLNNENYCVIENKN